MMQTPEMPVMIASPSARSGLYKLLSLVFRYPTSRMFETYRNGEFLTTLFGGLSEIPHGKHIKDAEADLASAVRKELQGKSLLDLEVTFNRVFEVGAPEPPCPPYEGVYRKGIERTAILVEVAEFYRQFGLKMSAETGSRELPDHIVAELEFLHFLAFKESQAREEDTPDLLDGYVRAQKDFLERHLRAWTPDFAAKLGNTEAPLLFTAVGRVLSRFIVEEHAYVSALLEWSRTDAN